MKLKVLSTKQQSPRLPPTQARRRGHLSHKTAIYCGSKQKNMKRNKPQHGRRNTAIDGAQRKADAHNYAARMKAIQGEKDQQNSLFLPLRPLQ